MDNRQNISAELMEIAPALASLNREMPFAVPEGYFDMLPIEMLGQVMPAMSSLAVPEGYFESLPAILLEKAKASTAVPAEKEDEFAVLSSISRQMPYSVPVNYFEKLVIPVPQQGAKVIPINRPFKKLAGWAVAASILALVSVFGWRYFNGEDHTNGNGQMAVNQAAVADSVSTAELAHALSQVADKNLDAELDNYGLEADQSALYYLSTVNFEKALQSISDDELSKNLEAQVYYDKKS